MSQQWIIEAHSPSLNFKLRQVSLEKQAIVPVTDSKQANLSAATFAATLNRKQHMKATDWVGTVRPQPADQGFFQYRKY